MTKALVAAALALALAAGPAQAGSKLGVGPDRSSVSNGGNEDGFQTNVRELISTSGG